MRNGVDTESKSASDDHAVLDQLVDELSGAANAEIAWFASADDGDPRALLRQRDVAVEVDSSRCLRTFDGVQRSED